MIKDWISKITDRYTEDPDSNIGKVLRLISGEVDDLSDTIRTVELWRDLQQAEGTTLDLIGANFSQPRGQMTDEIYRSIIIAKIVQGQSDGTYDRIIQAICKTLNCSPTDLSIQSSKEAGDDEPATIIIQKAPLAALNRIGLSGNQMMQIINNVVSGGISVARANFEGTFAFASGGEVESDSEGFADIEQTTGGIFGGVMTPDNDYKLPI
ncbi:hypothetical protein NIE88_18935 [Sporolactobacillus shoreicorticis]|uniref:DUF2612 domain-containing protein n=1 Tax=Sporolactobacillus shoreicorticis TaxID=1923877 RepID=A0ABW5S5W2_9BACL|nr:hypothetical protein [Sporolactobacillus shoreicorticis]MCO7127826.1 hypothetical protein [Sporolactobacillus shoreicorticis]